MKVRKEERKKTFKCVVGWTRNNFNKDLYCFIVSRWTTQSTWDSRRHHRDKPGLSHSPCSSRHLCHSNFGMNKPAKDMGKWIDIIIYFCGFASFPFFPRSQSYKFKIYSISFIFPVLLNSRVSGKRSRDIIRVFPTFVDDHEDEEEEKDGREKKSEVSHYSAVTPQR